MAVEFNVTVANQFFLGEDKIIDLVIFGQDGVTPLDISGLPLEWNMRKTDKAGDPALLVRKLSDNTLTIVGTFNVDPLVNTQKVRLTFVPADTNVVLKAGVAYRHSLKRLDTSNNNILTYGSITFLQATEH